MCSRPLGFHSTTIATRSLSTLAPLPPLLGSHFLMLFRCSSGRLRPSWSLSEFGTTLRIDNPEDAWFRQARGPRNQNVAERGYLSCVDLLRPLAKRTMEHCDGPLRHHCHQPPHDEEDCTVFTSFHLTWQRSRELLVDVVLGLVDVALDGLVKRQASCVQYLLTAVGLWWLHLVLRHRFLPVFSAWHYVFHAPAFRCHRKSLPGTCAESRAWKFLYVSFFSVAFSTTHSFLL